jgi:hypothetical protein
VVLFEAVAHIPACLRQAAASADEKKHFRFPFFMEIVAGTISSKIKPARNLSQFVFALLVIFDCFSCNM